MRQLLTVVGFSSILFLVSTGTAMAEETPPNVDCNPFSIACGYTIQVGPFNIDHIFEPQP